METSKFRFIFEKKRFSLAYIKCARTFFKNSLQENIISISDQRYKLPLDESFYGINIIQNP